MHITYTVYALSKFVHTYAYTCTFKGLHYTVQLNMSHQCDRPSEQQRGNELERWGVDSKRQKKNQRAGTEGDRENVIE